MAALLVFGLAGGTLDVAQNAQGVRVEAAYGRPVMTSMHSFYSLGAMTGALAGGGFAWAGVSPALSLAAAGAVRCSHRRLRRTLAAARVAVPRTAADAAGQAAGKSVLPDRPPRPFRRGQAGQAGQAADHRARRARDLRDGGRGRRRRLERRLPQGRPGHQRGVRGSRLRRVLGDDDRRPRGRRRAHPPLRRSCPSSAAAACWPPPG